MNFCSVLRHFKTKVVSEKTWNILRGGLFVLVVTEHSMPYTEFTRK